MASTLQMTYHSAYKTSNLRTPLYTLWKIHGIFMWSLKPSMMLQAQESLGVYTFLFSLPEWLSGQESACNAGDLGSIPGSGRSPGERNGNPLQYSCLGKPMHRGPWWATVHGVTKESDTTVPLKNIFLFTCFSGWLGHLPFSAHLVRLAWPQYNGSVWRLVEWKFTVTNSRRVSITLREDHETNVVLTIKWQNFLLLLMDKRKHSPNHCQGGRELSRESPSPFSFQKPPSRGGVAAEPVWRLLRSQQTHLQHLFTSRKQRAWWLQITSRLLPDSFFFVLTRIDLDLHLPNTASAIYLCRRLCLLGSLGYCQFKKCESWEETKGCPIIMSICHSRGMFWVQNGLPFCLSQSLWRTDHLFCEALFPLYPK